jgi:hypothetical protein
MWRGILLAAMCVLTACQGRVPGRGVGAEPLEGGVGHRESSEGRVVHTNDLSQGLTDDLRNDEPAFAARTVPRR